MARGDVNKLALQEAMVGVNLLCSGARFRFGGTAAAGAHKRGMLSALIWGYRQWQQTDIAASADWQRAPSNASS
jgi:hypothetical protein